jgi:hypothetical protein
VTLVMSGGLDLAWGNLVLQPGFVPLLHALVGHLARRSPAAPAQVRGTVLDLARAADNLPGGHAWRRYLAAGGHVIAELPGGRQQALPAGEILYRLDASGLYQLHRADGAGPVLPVAVNPDRDESQLAPAAVAELEQRVSRRTRPPERPPGPAAGVAGAERLPPGWYLLAAAALLLWLEALVANRLTWRRQAALERAP